MSKSDGPHVFVEPGLVFSAKWEGLSNGPHVFLKIGMVFNIKGSICWIKEQMCGIIGAQHDLPSKKERICIREKWKWVRVCNIEGGRSIERSRADCQSLEMQSHFTFAFTCV